MAQGRRPDPFRTRKLRPVTAMVLHPEGCGRVARRRTQTLKGRGHHNVPPPFPHTPDTHAGDHPLPVCAYTTHGTRHAGTSPCHTPSVNRQAPNHTHDRPTPPQTHHPRPSTNTTRLQEAAYRYGSPSILTFHQVVYAVRTQPHGLRSGTIRSLGVRRPVHARVHACLHRHIRAAR